jgi:hypothetical protein
MNWGEILGTVCIGLVLLFLLSGMLLKGKWPRRPCSGSSNEGAISGSCGSGWGRGDGSGSDGGGGDGGGGD